MRSRVFSLFFVLCFSAIAGHSCSTSKPSHPARRPGSVAGSSSASNLRALGSFKDLVASPTLSSKSCANLLEIYVSEQGGALSDRSAQSLEAVQALWSARLELRKKMRLWSDSAELSVECVNQARKALQYVRELEESLAVSKIKVLQSDSVGVWEGSFPYVMLAPGYLPDAQSGGSAPQLKSGDIILGASESFLSSAISRVVDVESPWSHLGLVYVDPANQSVYVIQAQLEDGVSVKSWAEYLKENFVRSALFRYKDPAVAAKGALSLYRRVTAAVAEGASIGYDFQFNLEDPAELFSAEVAYLAFSGSVRLPFMEAPIHKIHREFLSELGVQGSHLFVPGDIEVDPRFKEVAEWRDFNRSAELQLKDQIMRSMYEWMENYHYVLQKTSQDRIKGGIVWELRRWPVFSRILKDRFPQNMPLNVIELAYSLNQVGQRIFDSIDRRNTGSAQFQIRDALEKLRVEDFSRWEAWKDFQRQAIDGESAAIEKSTASQEQPEAPLFHLEFHPPE